MPRIRPVRTLSAALIGSAVLWAAGVSDPAWAEAAGVDVWNLGRLEAELQEADAAGLRWQEAAEHAATRHRVNELVIDDLIAGLPLPTAAARMWAVNHAVCGYRQSIEDVYAGPTVEAKAAHNLIVRVTHRLAGGPADVRSAILARLRAEYRAAYGVQVPDGMGWVEAGEGSPPSPWVTSVARSGRRSGG